MSRTNDSLNIGRVDPETLALIENAARVNRTSMSSIARMLLDTIKYLPPEKLRHVSPVPGILGISKEETHAE